MLLKCFISIEGAPAAQPNQCRPYFINGPGAALPEHNILLSSHGFCAVLRCKRGKRVGDIEVPGSSRQSRGHGGKFAQIFGERGIGAGGNKRCDGDAIHATQYSVCLPPVS